MLGANVFCLERALVSSRGTVFWCVGRWTHRGIVVLRPFFFWGGVVSYGGSLCSCVWLSPALVKLDASRHLSC